MIEIYWLSTIGWYHLIVFTFVIPLLAWRSRVRLVRAGAGLTVTRLRYFRSGAVALILFGLLSLLTASRQDMDLFSAGIRWPRFSALAAGLMYAAAVRFMRPRWRRAVEGGEPHVQFFMPSTAAERRWWVLLSMLAGVSEEITWRGVQPALAGFVAGGPVAGAVVAAGAFGAAHAVQGLRGVVMIAAFGLAFQALVWLSGSLYPAMVVHAAYDITAGLAYGRLGRQSGESPA